MYISYDVELNGYLYDKYLLIELLWLTGCMVNTHGQCMWNAFIRKIYIIFL